MSSSSVRVWSAARPATRWSRLALASPPGSRPIHPCTTTGPFETAGPDSSTNGVGEPCGPLHAVHRGHRRLLGGEVPGRLRSERRERRVPLGPRIRGDERVDDPVGPAGTGQSREDDGHDDRQEDDHERARAPVAPQVRRRDQRCRSHLTIIGRGRRVATTGRPCRRAVVLPPRRAIRATARRSSPRPRRATGSRS